MAGSKSPHTDVDDSVTLDALRATGPAASEHITDTLPIQDAPPAAAVPFGGSRPPPRPAAPDLPTGDEGSTLPALAATEATSTLPFAPGDQTLLPMDLPPAARSPFPMRQPGASRRGSEIEGAPWSAKPAASIEPVDAAAEHTLLPLDASPPVPEPAAPAPPAPEPAAEPAVDAHGLPIRWKQEPAAEAAPEAPAAPPRPRAGPFPRTDVNALLYN